MTLNNPYIDKINEFSQFTFDLPKVTEDATSWKSFLEKQTAKKRTLEIGCANGIFLTKVAEKNPDQFFIGLDYRYKSLYKAARWVDKRELRNIGLVRGDANHLKRLFSENSLDEVWIFFPDPWAKKAQLKHRLINPEFLSELRKLMKPNSKLYFKTDHPGYFQWVWALFGKDPVELPAYDHAELDERSWRARQVKVRRLMKDEDLPKPSKSVQKAFSVVSHSVNFWAEEEKFQLPFSGISTHFEKTFVDEKLPIYFIEFDCLK